MARPLIVHPDAAEELNDLCIYPERGSLRDGTVQGLRIIGFRQRLSIAFVALENDVLVLGFFYAGRNLDPNLLTQRVKSTESP